MDTPKQYLLLSELSSANFNQSLNRYTADGWKPLGEHKVTHDPTRDLIIFTLLLERVKP